MATKRPREESPIGKENNGSLAAAATVMAPDQEDSNIDDSINSSSELSRGRPKDDYDICVGYHLDHPNIPVYVRGGEANKPAVHFRVFVEDMDSTVSLETRDLLCKRPTISRSKVVFVAAKFADYDYIDLSKFNNISQLTDGEKFKLAMLLVYTGEESEGEDEKKKGVIDLTGMKISGDLLHVGNFVHDPSVKVWAYLTQHASGAMLKFRASQDDIDRSLYQIKRSISFKSIVLLQGFVRGGKKPEENTKKYIRDVLLFISDGGSSALPLQAPVASMTPLTADGQSSLPTFNSAPSMSPFGASTPARPFKRTTWNSTGMMASDIAGSCTTVAPKVIAPSVTAPTTETPNAAVDDQSIALVGGSTELATMSDENEGSTSSDYLAAVIRQIAGENERIRAQYNNHTNDKVDIGEPSKRPEGGCGS